MLATIDLTQRQAARVLAQALRTRVRLEIESRSREGTISGSLAGAENSTLCVELHDHGVDTPLAGQIGSFCDIRAVLSGHLYLFSTCIVDVLESTVPQRLLLAIPDTVQIVNRRQFNRTIAQEHIALHLWPGGTQHPFVGTLTDIGPAGLGCQMPRRDLEHLLLIDDEVRVRFQLPGEGNPSTSRRSSVARVRPETASTSTLAWSSAHLGPTSRTTALWSGCVHCSPVTTRNPPERTVKHETATSPQPTGHHHRLRRGRA